MERCEDCWNCWREVRRRRSSRREREVRIAVVQEGGVVVGRVDVEIEGGRPLVVGVGELRLSLEIDSSREVEETSLGAETSASDSESEEASV